MSLAGGLRELLRPPPHRGPLIAAGAVALGVGIALEELRLEDRLSNPVHMVILLLSGGLLFWLGCQSPNEDGVPPAYQSVLLVTGLFGIYGGLLTAADVLGADFDSLPNGGLVWTSAVAGGLALWPAFERNSAISLLLAALLGGVTLVSGWHWLFGAASATPYRWLMLAYAIGLVLCALALREPARRHGEVLIDAAALAIASIAVIASIEPFSLGFNGLPGFWEVVLLGAGLGLVAFGALDRSPGPAYLGVVNLVLFILDVGSGSEETLFWWPLVLLAGGVAMLAAGLRPRAPLPPEPSPYRAGEAPLASRADDGAGEAPAAPPAVDDDDGEIVIRVRDDS